jgi:DtxR family transcriptional regulator, Mn-dependent transcriptional regulator
MTAVRAAAGLTAPVEDYLKIIFELETEGGLAGTNEIAAALGIAPPSASGMVRRLAEQGLIDHERYRGARLTPAGRRIALRTIRRHRLIESYLTTALGYAWDCVHDEAERLEHAASDELVERMASAIGEPTTDPHGAPIPTRDGRLDDQPLMSLNGVAAGARVCVQRVADRDAEQLRRLAKLGITPGQHVEVLSSATHGHDVRLRVGRATRSITTTLASQVLVSAIG